MVMLTFWWSCSELECTRLRPRPLKRKRRKHPDKHHQSSQLLENTCNLKNKNLTWKLEFDMKIRAIWWTGIWHGNWKFILRRETVTQSTAKSSRSRSKIKRLYSILFYFIISLVELLNNLTFYWKLYNWTSHHHDVVYPYCFATLLILQSHFSLKKATFCS